MRPDGSDGLFLRTCTTCEPGAFAVAAPSTYVQYVYHGVQVDCSAGLFRGFLTEVDAFVNFLTPFTTVH